MLSFAFGAPDPLHGTCIPQTFRKGLDKSRDSYVRSQDVTGNIPDYSHVPCVLRSLRGQRLSENRRGQRGTALRPQTGTTTGWDRSCLDKAPGEVWVRAEA